MRTYALDRAAAELKQQLDHYGIEVPEGQRIIVTKDHVTKIPEFTPRAKCKTILNRLIKKAKQEEFERTQGSLL